VPKEDKMGLFSNKQPEEPQYQPQPEEYMQQGVPMPVKSDRADMIDKLNPLIAVNEFRMNLMGYEDIDGQFKPIKELQGITLSAEGAWEISNLVKSAANNIMQNGRITKEEKNMRLLGVIDTANEMMLANWQLYGIKNSATIKSVGCKVHNFMLGILSQATNGSMQELWKGTVYEQRLTSDRNERQGGIKGLLGIGGR
jgi:hypothetical protein